MSKTAENLLELFERVGEAPALIVNDEATIPNFDGERISFEWISTDCDCDALCEITEENWMETAMIREDDTIDVDGSLAGECADFTITILEVSKI
jgi:hypothetical protein